MKNLIYTLLAAAIASVIAMPAALGQEEERQAPLEVQDSVASLTKLADRVKNFGFLDYARKLVDKLDKRERSVDPFGMPMDPKDAKAVELAMPVEDLAEDQPKTSLQEALEKFRVTGVIPERGEVIVGARSLRVGDQIVIKHGEVSFNLKIQSVRADSVELVDLETGEHSGVSLGIVQSLPQGMTRNQPVRPTPTESESNGIVPMNRPFLTLE